MRYSDSELRELGARAMPLWERLRGGVLPAPSPADQRTVASRVARWRSNLSGEDPGADGAAARLARRLELDDLSEAGSRPFLGTVRLPQDHPPPTWARTFQQLLAGGLERRAPRKAAVGSRAQEPTDWQAPGRPLPFEELLVPFVEQADRRLETLAGDALCELLPPARRSLRHRLASSLSHLAAFALASEFQTFVALHDPLSLLGRDPADSSGEIGNTDSDGDDATGVPRTLYDRFVDRMLDGRLLVFFCQYPVLARLWTHQIEDWIGRSADFVQRLRRDRRAIAETFAGGRSPGPVVALNAGLSDPHHGGETVIRVAFDGGLKLIYKPKDLAIDQAFFDLVAWANALPLSQPLGVLEVLPRERYGWMEYVEPQPCPSRAAAKRYYHGAGMLLAVVYALYGSDCHSENLIAAGDHPVLVDLETLMQHRVRRPQSETGEEAMRLAAQSVTDSVLRTGLLPSWRKGDDGRSYDASGFGGAADQPTGFRFPIWRHVNTDRMALVYREGRTPPRTNNPTFDGEPLTPQAFADDVAAGFDEMYRCLLAHRDRLLADDGPLADFRARPVRFVVRPTRVYARLLGRLRHPEFLRDGADRSIELEGLMQAFVPTSEQDPVPPGWPAYREEIRALERQDIPFFLATTDSTALQTRERRVIPGFFEEPSWERVAEQIRAFSEEDRDRQLAYLRAALALRGDGVGQKSVAPGAGPQAAAGRPAEPPPADPQELIRAASAIAEDIARRAIRAGDGSVTWITIGCDPVFEHHRLQPMGNSLYDGRPGVALFLAALARVSGEDRYRDLTLAAVAPLRALASGDRPRQVVSGIGAASGVGSWLYALTQVGCFLGVGELLDEARRLVDWIDDRQLAKDRQNDVISGAAGAILGLLAYAEQASGRRDREAAITRARACGEHLLAGRERASSGHRVWRIPSAQRPLAGFSHGAAGIAYALLRLAAATGGEPFAAAAHEAIAYEGTLYSPVEGNWPDLRDLDAAGDGEERFMNAWCHGAPGIGLARLGGYRIDASEAISRDIENALRTTLGNPLWGADHLCCGNTGRLEVLIEAACGLGRPAYLEAARRHAASVLRRAAERGHYVLRAAVPDAVGCPSFFQGTAGIGYTLLRLAAPARLPSALLWAV
jgi:type 2 lantibiotic biosynthesis protein LanM